MRSYHHNAYALRAQDIAAMDAIMADELAIYAADVNALPPVGRVVCAECGIGHVGACDTHAVQVALILSGVAR